MISPIHAKRMFASNADYRDKCAVIANSMAKAEPSDTFVFSRVMCHFKSGIAYPHPDEGYSVDWTTETRSYERDGETIEYPVRVPINRKRV